jgi:hypothetical protein
LEKLQDSDPELHDIRIKVENEDPQSISRFRVYDGVLYSRDNPRYPYWRVCMPTSLEARLINFVHESYGLLGSDKCLKSSQIQFISKILGGKF